MKKRHHSVNLFFVMMFSYAQIDGDGQIEDFGGTMANTEKCWIVQKNEYSEKMAF